MQVLKDEIRDRIIRAAVKEFLQNGFSEASMRKIAKKARISVSNLYNYYQNKEELFYSVTDPVHLHIDNLFKHLIEYESEEDFSNEKFVIQLTEHAATAIGELIKKYRNQFLLIMDQSSGTKYENYKRMIISAIEDHFKEHVRFTNRKKKDLRRSTFIMHLIATNLIEGFLEISRHYENDEWVDYNINALLKYHIQGISQFLK